MSKVNKEGLQQLVARYRVVGEPWPASTHAIAEWAVRSDRWTPQNYSALAYLAVQIGRAMREEYITDPQGRRVRAKHAATVTDKGKQLTLWVGMRDTSVPNHRRLMNIALRQRRQGIMGDCLQLKSDADSYNENYNPGEQIEIVFDFRADLEEAELLKGLRSNGAGAKPRRSAGSSLRYATGTAQRT